MPCAAGSTSSSLVELMNDDVTMSHLDGGYEALTYEKLLDMHDRVKEVVDATSKFTLPGRDEVLDMRDYHLHHVDGVGWLLHLNGTSSEQFLNGISGPGLYKRLMPRNSLILLKNIDIRMIEKMIELWPNLAVNPNKGERSIHDD
jgi:hypothetical protein